MIEVTLLIKKDCLLCDEAEALLQVLKAEWNFHLTKIDIYEDDALLEKYHLMIPVVLIDGEEVDYGQISKEKVESYLKTRNWEN